MDTKDLLAARKAYDSAHSQSMLAHESYIGYGIKHKRKVISLLSGLIISLIIAAGLIIMGIFMPKANLERDKLIEVGDGEYYLFHGQNLHLIANIVSARLLLEQPIDPKQASVEILEEYQLGNSLGILEVPSLRHAPEGNFALCSHDATTKSSTFVDIDNLMVKNQGKYWAVFSQLRYEIPDSVVENWGANAIGVSDRQLGLIPLRTPLDFPQGPSSLPGDSPDQGSLLSTGEGYYLVGDAGVSALAGARLDYARSFAPVVDASPDFVATLPKIEILTDIPEEIDWFGGSEVCVGDRVFEQPKVDREKTDTRNYSPMVGSSAVTTEYGLFILSDQGERFSIPSSQELEWLGFDTIVETQWPVIAGLEDRGMLSQERVLENSHSR